MFVQVALTQGVLRYLLKHFFKDLTEFDVAMIGGKLFKIHITLPAIQDWQILNHSLAVKLVIVGFYRGFHAHFFQP